MHEIPTFDLLSCIKIDPGRIYHTGKNSVLCRHQIFGLHHHIGRTKEGQALIGLIGGIAAGDFVALGVPGLLRLGIGLDPGLGLGSQIVFRVGQLVDQTFALRLFCSQTFALTDQANGFLHAQQIGHAHNATGAGHQTNHCFRQANLHAIHGNPVVAGQRDFKTAAQAGTVNAHGNRYTQGLQLAQRRLGLHDALINLSFLFIAGVQVHFQQLFDIAAGKELAGLAAANIDTSDTALLYHAFQFGDGGAHGLVVFSAHGVNGFAGLVENQFDNAVAVFL